MSFGPEARSRARTAIQTACVSRGWRPSTLVQNRAIDLLASIWTLGKQFDVTEEDWDRATLSLAVACLSVIGWATGRGDDE